MEMRTQRKIQHLLVNNGEPGEDFRYLPVMSHYHNFHWNRGIYCTDKIDGTTVQGNCEGIFKRIDRFKRGDPRKHTASEEERYKLIKLDNNPQWKWIWEAISFYKKQIETIPSHITAYFEVFGPKINATYRDMSVHDLRIFDFTKHDKFVHFEDVNRLAWKYGIPTVGSFFWSFTEAFAIESILDVLAKKPKHIEASFANYTLEGWVFRQGLEIAKIRVSDLEKVWQGI